MFVAKYPEFVAGVVFQDGSRAWFDGVKDLMKFYFRPAAYQPERTPEDIAGVVVTEYYTLKQIDLFSLRHRAGSPFLCGGHVRRRHPERPSLGVSRLAGAAGRLSPGRGLADRPLHRLPGV